MRRIFTSRTSHDIQARLVQRADPTLHMVASQWAGGLHRDLIIAIVDARDHVARANVRVVIKIYCRHVT